MNCFQCAKTSDAVVAVAICHQCGVGLCLDHLIEATHFSVGGTHEGCGHTVPRAKPPADVSEGIVASARRRTADVV